jgi:hypothetical protein
MSGLGQKSGELSGSDKTSVPEKRRMRSAREKQRIVRASFKPGVSVRAVAERAGRFVGSNTSVEKSKKFVFDD